MTAPPVPAGWQTVYEIGVQDERPVVNAITIRSLVGVPRGGLTAETAHALIRPGKALREFAQSVEDRRAMPDATDEEIAALMAGRQNWRNQPTAEFRRYLQYLESLPAIETFLRRRRMSRRERVALTARDYYEAFKQGHPDPRKRVAELQNRTDASVSADLHAARNESPQLLTAAAAVGYPGGELTREAIRILDAMAKTAIGSRPDRKKPRAARPTRKGGQR